MSAEFILSFDNENWYSENRNRIDEEILSLKTFNNKKENEYWLLGIEDANQNERWEFDVRIFMRKDEIFLEISSHPVSIENDLLLLFGWIRQQTEIMIHDEDGELSKW